MSRKLSNESSHQKENRQTGRVADQTQIHLRGLRPRNGQSGGKAGGTKSHRQPELGRQESDRDRIQKGNRICRIGRDKPCHENRHECEQAGDQNEPVAAALR